LSSNVVTQGTARQATRRGGFLGASARVLGRDWKIAWFFFFPSALLLVGLVAYPLASAVWTSLHIAVGPRVGAFVGLDNYIDLWTDDDQFTSSVWQTIRFTFWSVFFKFWLGLAAAVMLHQKIKARNLLTALVLLPWIVPEVVTALAWRGIFDPVFGGLNGMLLYFGVIDKGIAWLGTPQLALPSVTAVNVWKGIPFFTITLLAGMKSSTPSCTMRRLSTAPARGVSSCTSRCRACATSSSSARCCRRSGRSTTSASSTC